MKPLRFVFILSAVFATSVVCSGCGEQPVDPNLTKIAVTKRPSKSTYYVGEKFSTEGMVVTATYSDASTANVTNSVVIKAQPVNQVMFTGPGAGEMPTASSVCADVLALVSEIHSTNNLLPQMKCTNTETADIMPIEETTNKYFIRIDAGDTPGVIGNIGNICSKFGINLNYIIQKEVVKDTATIVILTGACKENALTNALNEINNMPAIKAIHKVIRVMEL